MSVLSALEWVARTPWSVALHESLYVWPLLESTHVLTLTLFVGTALMLDLRLLGLALRRVPVCRPRRSTATTSRATASSPIARCW